MIIVIGAGTVDPAALPRLLPEMATAMAAARDDEGCLHYALAVVNADGGVVSVVERWSSEATLRAHLAQAHTQAFLSALGPTIRSLELTMFDASNERPLEL